MEQFGRRLPALCCITAAMLMLALLTDGFLLVWRNDRTIVWMAGHIVGVQLLFSLLSGIGLALCDPGHRRMTAIISLCSAVGAIFSVIPLIEMVSRPGWIDLSSQLPAFLIMLLGVHLICHSDYRSVVIDFLLFGLCTCLLFMPVWLFGWGISVCFFDTLCVSTTLMVLFIVHALLACRQNDSLYQQSQNLLDIKSKK